MPRLPTFHEARNIRHPALDSPGHMRSPSPHFSLYKGSMIIAGSMVIGVVLTMVMMTIQMGHGSSAPQYIGVDQSNEALSAQQGMQGILQSRRRMARRAQELASFSQQTQMRGSKAGSIGEMTGDSHLIWPTPVMQLYNGKLYEGMRAPALKLDDFVFGVVTSKAHEYLALEGRLWRQRSTQGIRAFLASNYTLSSEQQAEGAKYNETWSSYPDDKPLRSLALSGDTRAALTPFLAHQHYGDSYKWLLYGDDDTFFSMHGLMTTLQDLDPEMPYFLTDHMWWTEYRDGRPDQPRPGSTHHPHQLAPRCVPCNYQKNTSSLPFKMPAGCPCTPQLLCQADPEQDFLVHNGPRGDCGIPRIPVRTFSMHGGAGAVLSIGLLRAISLERFEDCVHRTYSSGGDAFISICLWEAGYGMTDIDPLWHPKNRTMFDVGRIAQLDSEDVRGRLAVVLGTYLMTAARVAGGMSKVEFDHTLTLHMRSRMFPSHLAHGETTRVLAGLAVMAGGQPNPFAKFSTNEVTEAINAQVRLALQAVKGLGSTKVTPPITSKDGLQQPLSTLLEEASIAAAQALAHSILNKAFGLADPSPPPPPSNSSKLPSPKINVFPDT